MKKRPFNVVDFGLGLLLGLVIALLFANNQLSKIATGNAGTSSGDKQVSINGDSDVVSTTQKDYDTNIKDWTMTCADGTEFSFKTPENFYSLSDQYADTMTQYYGTEFSADNTVCVGDDQQQYQSSVLINASPLSNTKKVVEAVYADDDSVNVDDFKYSEAYQYILTGEMDESIENVELLELDSITTTQGKTFRVFQVDRDTEYYTDDTQTETTMVHSTELIAYSDNEDAMEVLVYMNEFDKDAGIKYLTEFLN